MLSLKVPTPVLVAAIVLAIGAIAWGFFAAAWAAFPGPSGEWAALAVPASFIVNAPVGLLTLALGILADRRSPRLRRLTIISAAMALVLPLAVALIWRYR